jgi:hypothetical protein
MKGSFYLCLQITGRVENAVPLHADIPFTGRRGSDLAFEDILQEYLPFPYEYFLYFHLGVSVVNFALQTTPEEKTQGLGSGERAVKITTADNSVPEYIGQSLHRYTCSRAVSESC